MEIEFKKATEIDIPGINDLLDHWNGFDLNIKSRDLLFENQWNNPEDSFGIIAVSGDRIIGFLGVFFSTRLINNKDRKIASLTSFFIHPDFRGYKLTYKIIHFLKSIDNYIIYAITPISGTNNIYLSNSFKPLEKQRIIYKKPLFKLNSSSNKLKLSTNPELIQNKLNSYNLNIYLNHKNFDCKNLIFEINGEIVFLVIKSELISLGNLINKRRFFYFTKILNYVIRKNFAEKLIKINEVYYCSDYNLLKNNLVIFLKEYLKMNDSKYLSLRYDIFRNCEKNRFEKYKLVKNDQFYFSNDIVPIEELDLLYSELFVLN
jgi:hypothetical protein